MSYVKCRCNNIELAKLLKKKKEKIPVMYCNYNTFFYSLSSLAKPKLCYFDRRFTIYIKRSILIIKNKSENMIACRITQYFGRRRSKFEKYIIIHTIYAMSITSTKTFSKLPKKISHTTVNSHKSQIILKIPLANMYI